MGSLIFLQKWPDIMQELDATELYREFKKPILIHLNKGAGNPIVLSTLLHGNEHSGFEALKIFFKKHPAPTKELLIFIGNIQAAKDNQRQTQSGDYNRLWSDDIKERPEFVDVVKNYIRELKPDFSIDIHNNTGKNPLYSCISELDERHQILASYFGEATVFFKEPHSAFSVYHSNHFISMTVEAGISKEEEGIEKLMVMLEEVILSKDNALIPHHAPRKTYHTIGKVKLPVGSEIAFGETTKEFDFLFDENLDELNFTHLMPGFILAQASKLPIVLDDDYNDVASDFLKLEENNLVITNEIVPAMLTKNTSVIKSDGLCYFMVER